MLCCHCFIFLQKAMLERFLLVWSASALSSGLALRRGFLMLTLTFLFKGKTSGALLNLLYLNWKLALQSVWGNSASLLQKEKQLAKVDVDGRSKNQA